MADLIAIGYPDEVTAELAATEARRLAKDLIIEPDAIAVISRDTEGNFHVHTSDHPVGAGATWGMFWGLLFGLLFSIPFFGLAIGAGMGALMGKITRSGIDPEFQDQVRDMLQPGTSALFLMVEKVTPDKAVDALSQYGGTALKSSVSKEGGRDLQEALHRAEAYNYRSAEANLPHTERGGGTGVGIRKRPEPQPPMDEEPEPICVRGDSAAERIDADVVGVKGEEARPPMVTRFLHAEFPTHVRTGASFILLAKISELERGAQLSAALRPVAAGSKVMLTCSASGFELRSEMQVTVAVPLSGDSDPAPFELVATDTGLQTITLRAFAGSAYLGALSIQVMVDSAGRTEQPVSHSAALSRREWQQGEVTLEIEYDIDKKLYTYRWRDGTFTPDVSFHNDEQLQRTPIEVVDGIVQELNTLARGARGYSSEAAQDWLKNQGIGLWQSFFPARLQAQFRDNWDKITRLSIISSNDLIPWELLYVSDEYGELGYLAENFPIARLPRGGVPPKLHFGSADFVCPPKDSPAAAAKEVEAIGDILSSRGVDVHTAMTDLDSVRGLLAAGEFSLLHIASHNSFSRMPPFAKITLGRGAFDPSFLNQYRPRASFRTSSPLVFINACGSDRRTPVYTQLGGWADAFLGAGAGAFIGSLWEVRDSSSLRFATALYTALTEGRTVGEAIALARQKLRSDDPSDPTWLAYTLWGDPAAEVQFGSGT